jgi:hypothetical protein
MHGLPLIFHPKQYLTRFLCRDETEPVPILASIGRVVGVAQGRLEWPAGGSGWVWPWPCRERPGGGQSGAEAVGFGLQIRTSGWLRWGGAGRQGVAGKKKRPNYVIETHVLNGRSCDI